MRKTPTRKLGDLDKLYADESHCLACPEIRSDKDNPILRLCRDAIADARICILHKSESRNEFRGYRC
jgi:hypothetical protein